MKKVAWIISGILMLIMLIALAVGLTYGETLSFQSIDLIEFTQSGEPKATCLAYHSEVISTVENYNTFLEDCEFTVAFDYDEQYFESNVFVVYYYDGSSSLRPKSFHNNLFTVENHHIIKVRSYYTPWFFVKKDAKPQFYFIEMTRSQISSGDVLFD